MDAAVQHSENRAEAVRQFFEAAGARLQEYYVAAGETAAYVVAEIPDHVSVAALTTAVHAGGAARVDSLGRHV